VTFTVDTHHHILPDFFFQATNEAGHPVGGIAPPPWSRASALSFLDDAGIDVAVTSISTPGVHTGDDAAARVIIDEMRAIPGAEARATAAETFRHLYWDTAASWSDPVLHMLRDVVGFAGSRIARAPRPWPRRSRGPQLLLPARRALSRWRSGC
jgi:hypothetical protein